MGTGQMMLTIGAMILLATIMLRINTGNISSSDSVMENKIELLAFAYSESIMNEAIETLFDENTTIFTSKDKFGKETGETADDFDDFDDFVCKDIIVKYKIDPNNNSTINFRKNIIINYVTPNFSGGNLVWDEAAGVTNYKQMILTIDDPNPIEDNKLFKNIYTFSIVKSSVKLLKE